MGIDAAYGIGSLKQGVCTSSTRPASPFEGQMIYETDTDLTYVYSGSAWQQVAGGTAVGNSGLVYVTSTTATSGTSISINNCFTSTYQNYKIVVSNLTSTGVAPLYFRLRASSSDATTSYYYNGTYMDYTSATVLGFNGSNLGYYDAGLVADLTMAGGSIDVFNPQVAFVTSFNCNGTDPRTTGGGARYSSGMHYANTSYDGFTIYNATFTNITVAVYGYRK
jgi:hypothetical protein